MRIAFAGTPEFAAFALRSLIDAGHEVALVLTQPDRPSGRGMKLKASPVKEVATANGIDVITPKTLSVNKDSEGAQEALSRLEEVKADVLIVAAYGLILPLRALNAAKGIGKGIHVRAINIHASLLPRWRGAAPIQRAIEAGDEKTGICIMQMQEGLDTGPVLLAKEVEISTSDTALSLTEKLTALGGAAIVEALERIDTLELTEQDDANATYAKKILKTESQIDWSLPASIIERRCRAFDPFPGLQTSLRGEVFKIRAVRLSNESGAPATVLCAKKKLVIACGEGALECIKLQKAGKPVMDVEPFLQSFPIAQGDTLQ